MSSNDLHFNIYKDTMGRYIITTIVAGVDKKDVAVQVHKNQIFYTVKRDLRPAIFNISSQEEIEKVSGKIQLNGVFKGDIKLPFEIDPANIQTIVVDGLLITTVSNTLKIN